MNHIDLHVKSKSILNGGGEIHWDKKMSVLHKLIKTSLKIKLHIYTTNTTIK